MRKVLLVALALAAAGCHGSSAGWGHYQECKETSAPAAAAPAKPPPPDGDFARLRAYRNYYSLDHVGAFEHHFAVWFQCIEPSVSNFAVAPDGTVRAAGGWWGGMAVRDGAPPPVPAEQEDNARLVLAAHDAGYDGDSGAVVQYLGSYREVDVGEVVPDGPPGDPFARMTWTQGATLRADADLATFDGLSNFTGGYTKLCWEDSTYRDCSARRWIDFAPAQGVGLPQLVALVSDGSPQPADERARFGAAALAAARAEVAGEPGAPLDPLLAAQGDTLLPPGLAPPVTVGFTVYARPGDGVEQVDSTLNVTLSVARVARGGAHGGGYAEIAGLPLDATVDARLDPPVAADDRGERQADLHVRYALRDNRGNARDGELVARAVLLVDGDAVVFRSLTMPDDAGNHVHDPPYAQHLPGVDGHPSIDAYVGVGATPEPWYPR